MFSADHMYRMSATGDLLGELRPTSSSHTRSWWKGVADDQDVLRFHRSVRENSGQTRIEHPIACHRLGIMSMDMQHG
jgi:hypothetical protein